MSAMLSSFLGFGVHRMGFLAVVLAMVPARASAASQAQRRSPPPQNQAVVTYVAGEVTVPGAEGGRRSIAVGDTLAPGTRLQLGQSSEVTVLWSRGGSSSFSGSQQTVTLVPPKPSQEKEGGGVKQVIANVWRAISTRLARLGRSDKPNAGLSRQPLAVRAPGDAWTAYPCDEYVLPGARRLQWHGPSGSGPSYLVMVWDAQFVLVWREVVEAEEVSVPGSVNLVAG